MGGLVVSVGCANAVTSGQGTADGWVKVLLVAFPDQGVLTQPLFVLASSQ